MPLVVFDIECLEGKIVKELGVFKDGIVLGYSFRPPKDYNPTFQAKWSTKNFMGLTGTMENWNILSCHQSFTNIFTYNRILCKRVREV